MTRSRTCLLTLRDAGAAGTATIGKANLNATVTDPAATPSIDGTLTADGVSAGSARSISARVTAKGPLDALDLTVTADCPGAGGRAGEADHRRHR